ncbi:hypothetical protein GCM10009565_22780 [Amycolatopsis albidoflavus]
MSVADVEKVLLPRTPQDAGGQVLADALAECRSRIDTAEDELEDVLATGPWELRSVELSGFRGIANGTGKPGAHDEPFLQEFPRSARVFVLQGANGTGKSTITDALEVALVGGTEPAAAFTPSALQQPVTRHAGAQRSDVVVTLENDHGDRLRLSWSDGASERAEVAWLPADSSEPMTARPGPAWAQAIASRHSIVGYDHWTHRLRVGHLTTFVHDRLRLGPVWWDLWHVLQREHSQSTDALTVWNQARQEAAAALDQVDERLALRHPYTSMPPKVRLPESPGADAEAWFNQTFPAATTSTRVPVDIDPRMTNAILDAQDEARAALESYRRAKKKQDSSLASDELQVLQDLFEHLAANSPGSNPTGEGERPAWLDQARRVLQDSQEVREEFNLAQARFSELRDLLLEQLLPLLKIAKGSPDISAAVQRLRSAIDPLVETAPRSEREDGWRAATKIVESSTFSSDVATVVDALWTTVDISDVWQSARRDCCRQFMTVHRSSGKAAAKVPGTAAALKRLGAAFDQAHQARRTVIAELAAGPLRGLLVDAGIDELALDVPASDQEGLNETTTLRLFAQGVETSPGSLSAGQYNALVLALLLSSAGQAPLRFVVLDDPVHAMDDFRTDKFAELIASRAADGEQVVLLTHDQRLVDVLRQHVTDLNVVKLSRDEHGNVFSLDATHPWQPLIDDAARILHSNTDKDGRAKQLSAATTAVLVLSFCRQAIDAVLREFVVEAASTPAAGKDSIARLGRAFTTRRALETAQKAVAREHAAHAVIGVLLSHQAFLKDLNAGSHGDPDSRITAPEHLRIRVRETARFCSDLLRTTA